MGILHEIARKARKNLYHISEEILFRWSPRLMSGEALTESDLLPLFDAARWAPSSRNSQEWRFYYALRGDRHFESLFCLLSENNRRWGVNAGALILLVSKKTTEDGRRLRTHALDTGMAVQNSAIEATRRDLVFHPIGGFDRHSAEAFLQLDEDHALEIMIAIGKPGDPENLKRDRAVSLRNAIETFAFRLGSE